MSETPRTELIANRLDVLAHAVADDNRSEFTMRVPADPDRDADLVLSEAARMIRTLAAVTAERDTALKDAERYRWLRGDSCADHSSRWMQWEVRAWQATRWTDDLRRAELDAAIDTAMKEQNDAR